jgi:hypothetical protein
MGASQSQSADPIDHADLQKRTEKERYLMEGILQFMLKELTIKDFTELSNPAKCKNYVIFMANNLFQYFQRIRVLPIMDARGFLAFRSYKELEKVSKEMEQEKQSLCLTLSYFYSRIFQIYGALALTLIDDVQYMTSSGIIQMKPTDFLRTPGMDPYHIQQPLRLRGGGPSREELGNFYFLTNILSSTKRTQPQKMRFSLRLSNPKMKRTMVVN